jgi:integration host factor subunit beta
MPKYKVTKSDIVDTAYEKTGFTRKDIRTVIDIFLDSVSDALVHGGSVELRGFGTFEVRFRKGRRKARNPKTGAILDVGSHGVAAFRAGRELKESVWNTGPIERPNADIPGGGKDE